MENCTNSVWVVYGEFYYYDGRLDCTRRWSLKAFGSEEEAIAEVEYLNARLTELRLALEKTGSAAAAASVPMADYGDSIKKRKEMLAAAEAKASADRKAIYEALNAFDKNLVNVDVGDVEYCMEEVPYTPSSASLSVASHSVDSEGS